MIAVQDLPGLPEVMPQAKNVCTAKHVAFEDYLKLFDPSVHEKIRASLASYGATHAVCFENLDLWSSQFGHRTSLVVGSKQSYTLEAVLTKPYSRLGDVPSRFQYPVAYSSLESKAAPEAVAS